MTTTNSLRVQTNIIADARPTTPKNIQELPLYFLIHISRYNNHLDNDSTRKTSGFMKMNFGYITELDINKTYKTFLLEKNLTILTTRNEEFLTSINLTSCLNISDKVVPDLAKLRNLNSLNLSYCLKIRGEYFGSLRNVKHLDLTGCTKIVPGGFKNLAGLFQLNTLILSRCVQINDRDIAHFATLRSLNSLYLNRCPKITDKIYKHLKPLKELELHHRWCVNMSSNKSKAINRHKIPDPVESDKALKLWANSLMQERIPDLFKTEEGLKGHVDQIQSEINRISCENLFELLKPSYQLTEVEKRQEVSKRNEVENRKEAEKRMEVQIRIEGAKKVLANVKQALVKSVEAQKQSGSFPLNGKHVVNFPLTHDKIWI